MSEAGRKRALEEAARWKAWADKQAEEQQADQADLASLSLPGLRGRLHRQVRLGGSVTLHSRWRRFIFYWHRMEQRMRVAVKRPEGLAAPRLRVLEALVAEMRRDRTRTCPTCHQAFERTGKQKFCSKLHAARYRKLRWRRAHRKPAA